jgi:imidazolonepropionase-like amidohydrolase
LPTLAPGDDAQAFVDARIAEGSDFIKIIYEHAYPTLTKQQLEDVVTAAHRRNKLVVAHVTRQSDARDAIAAGVDGLAHAFEDSAPESDFAEFAKQHHVFVIATLATVEGLGGASHWWQNIPHVVANISSTMRGSLELKFPPDADANRKFENAKAVVEALHRAGVPLLAGTDAPFPGVAHGLGLHRELQLLVLSGLSPSEALASATSDPARTFGFYDRGRIAAGMRADLLLVNGDPTVDINATHDIVGVWKLGVQHSRSSASAPAKQP